MENAVLSTALRLVSTLLLCAAGGGLGLAAAQKQERRWGQVHTFARLLSYIGQTLQYLPLPAADLLERAAAYPEFAALGAVACTQLSDLAPPAALPAPKRDEAQSLLRAAGESDRAGACEMLAAAAALALGTKTYPSAKTLHGHRAGGQPPRPSLNL